MCNPPRPQLSRLTHGGQPPALGGYFRRPTARPHLPTRDKEGGTATRAAKREEEGALTPPQRRLQEPRSPGAGSVPGPPPPCPPSHAGGERGGAARPQPRTGHGKMGRARQPHAPAGTGVAGRQRFPPAGSPRPPRSAAGAATEPPAPWLRLPPLSILSPMLPTGPGGAAQAGARLGGNPGGSSPAAGGRGEALGLARRGLARPPPALPWSRERRRRAGRPAPRGKACPPASPRAPLCGLRASPSGVPALPAPAPRRRGGGGTGRGRCPLTPRAWPRDVSSSGALQPSESFAPSVKGALII